VGQYESERESERDQRAEGERDEGFGDWRTEVGKNTQVREACRFGKGNL